MAELGYAQPWPLWLFALLPLAWLAVWRHRTPLSRLRLGVALALRSAAFAAVVLALMRPYLERGLHDVSVVYALDVSSSIAPDFAQTALAWMEEVNRKAQPAQARYLAFAGGAKLYDTLEALKSTAVTSRRQDAREGVVYQGASDLERALDLAQFGFASGYPKRLVLLSDGAQTEGDAWRALPRLRAQRVRVFALPAQAAVNRDAWIEAFEIPAGVRVQEPVSVGVRVAAIGLERANVILKRNGETIGSQDVPLAAGTAEARFAVTFAQVGESVLEAQVVAERDQVPDNNALSESTWVGAAPKFLYVEGAPANARYLRDALRKQGIEVSVVEAKRLAEAAAYEGQDGVILSDIVPDALNDAVTRRLEGFVREGGGLIFAAGENTYGKEGFAKSRLEKLLPVRFEAERKRKELDLVLLIDRSFSMRGQKLEFAKSAALSTLDLLEEQHRLAVIGFDSQPHEVVSLAPVGNKRRAEDSISSMSASGQTNVFTALWHAQRMLQDSQAKTKHMILLSDGNTAEPGKSADSRTAAVMAMVRKARGLPPEAEPAPLTGAPGGFAELAELLAAQGVTLSTVAIGEEPNLELMENLARWTKGKSHVAKSEAEIPSLFIGEARRLLGEAIVEEPFRPTVKFANESIAGIDFTRGPPLRGFVLGRSKPFSEVLLEAKDHQPLLLQTHHGLGKTVAFLSDVKNRWAADWLGWPGYGKLWAQVAREAIRREASEALALRVEREGRQAILSLDALTAKGQYRNELLPRVQVRAPDGVESDVLLRQVAPGRYQTRVPLEPLGSAPYRFRLLEAPGLTAAELARALPRSLGYAQADEYRVRANAHDLLRGLAERTGGKFAPKPEEVFADYGDGARVRQALWPYCAAATLVLLLLELLVRRLPHRRARFSVDKRGLSGYVESAPERLAAVG